MRAVAQCLEPTCAQALAQARETLIEAGIETPALDARLLVLEATGRSLEELVGAPDERLSAQEHARLARMLARRCAREPLAYILGRRAFWAFELAIAPGVFVPRPESETVVEAALEAVACRTKPLRILDLGTGSGCLLLALLSELPRAWGLGVDRAAKAVALARENAARLGLDGRTAFLRGDWHEAIKAGFDIVVCNAPYIPTGEIEELAPEVRAFEPLQALDGGKDGFAALRKVIAGLSEIVAQKGVLALEVGAGQAQLVERLLAAAGFREIVPKPDLAGIKRVVVARPGAAQCGNKKSVGRDRRAS